MQSTRYDKVSALLLPALLSSILLATPGSGASLKAEPATERLELSATSAKNETLITVPFITARNKTGNKKPSRYYGDERSIRSAGNCEIVRTSFDSLESIADKVSFYIPDDYAKLETIREMPVDDLWRDLKKSSGGQNPVLFVHGFFISFNRGCKRASLFQNSLGLDGRFVLFSWPSDGSILDYTRDESDLFWSLVPLQRTTREMVVRFGAGRANIVAHSLGARGVFLSLVRLAYENRGKKPLLNQVVFLAPDIDAGIFRQYLPLIRPLARRITIYVSDKDRALALSAQVHGYARLGEAGGHLNGLEGVEIIDVSELPTRTPSGHVYHLNDDTVISDLDQLLNGGKPASKRNNLKQLRENYWQLQPQADN